MPQLNDVKVSEGNSKLHRAPSTAPSNAMVKIPLIWTKSGLSHNKPIANIINREIQQLTHFDRGNCPTLFLLLQFIVKKIIGSRGGVCEKALIASIRYHQYDFVCWTKTVIQFDL